MTDARMHNHSALARTLLDLAAPVDVVLHQSAVTPWSSMTFSGARHCFDLILDDANGSQFAGKLASRLDKTDFELPGELVADLAIASHRRTSDGASHLRIEALTVASL